MTLLFDGYPGFKTPSDRSRLSNRRPAFRAAESGPWHAKQFSDRIGRTSRLKEIARTSSLRPKLLPAEMKSRAKQVTHKAHALRVENLVTVCEGRRSFCIESGCAEGFRRKFIGVTMRGVFSGREQESLEAKVLWFRTLSVEERLAYACEMADFILENQPDLARRRDAQTLKGRVRVLELPRS